MIIVMGSLLTKEFLYDNYGNCFSEEACSSILKLNDKFNKLSGKFNCVFAELDFEELSSENFLNRYKDRLTSTELDYDDDKQIEILIDRVSNSERLNNGNILIWC